MARDISDALREGHSYDPENPKKSVEVFIGDDGVEKIQKRQGNFGLFQYNLDGRPDGEKPFGMDFLVNHYIEESVKKGDEFSLTPGACKALVTEQDMLLQRSHVLYIYGDFTRSMRDSELRRSIINLIAESAGDEDRYCLEHYRPQIIGAIADAQIQLYKQEGKYKEAVDYARQAIEHLNGLPVLIIAQKGSFQIAHPEFMNHFENYTAQLNQYIKELQDLRDKENPEIIIMQEELRQAVQDQEFEKAAELRNQIKALGGRTLSEIKDKEG